MFKQIKKLRKKTKCSCVKIVLLQQLSWHKTKLLVYIASGNTYKILQPLREGHGLEIKGKIVWPPSTLIKPLLLCYWFLLAKWPYCEVHSPWLFDSSCCNPRPSSRLVLCNGTNSPSPCTIIHRVRPSLLHSLRSIDCRSLIFPHTSDVIKTNCVCQDRNNCYRP